MGFSVASWLDGMVRLAGDGVVKRDSSSSMRCSRESLVPSVGTDVSAVDLGGALLCGVAPLVPVRRDILTLTDVVKCWRVQ